MNHLVREKRLDKNGVLTTKLVRSTPKPAASKKTPPAPRLAPTQKGPKLRPNQTEQRARTFSSFHYEPHPVLEARRKHGKDYTFTASEAEIYNVLSVTHGGNALVLLELGIRTADDARDYLQILGANVSSANDLITERADLTSEMLKRNIRPDEYLANTNTNAGRVAFDSPFLADLIEFNAIKVLRDSYRNNETRKGILDGEINFADIKDIGASNLKSYDRLWGMHSTLRDYHRGELDCSLEDMKKFVSRANDEKLVLGHFKDAVHMLRNLSTKEVNEVSSLSTFASLFNSKADDKVEETRRAHYAAVLLEAMDESEVVRSARYYASEFPKDVEMLRSAGVSVHDAYPLMKDGMSAQQVIGVINGANAAVAEGWL